MNWLIANYDVIIGILVLITICSLSIYEFIMIGKEKQLIKVKEWLLYACIEAEKSLGSGTGVVKLRYVYDLFCGKFSFLKLVVSFEEFSEMVDQSLVTMREMLSTNENIKRIVSENK